MSEDGFMACGRHVLVDISNADRDALDDLETLERSLVAAATGEGVTVLGALRKAFRPSGVTVLVMLAESHLSLHTYPEQGKAFFDAFTCGLDYDPANIFRSFAENALPGDYAITSIRRGFVEPDVCCGRPPADSGRAPACPSLVD